MGLSKSASGVPTITKDTENQKQIGPNLLNNAYPKREPNSLFGLKPK